MSGTDTRSRILRKVQRTDKPALSAADLAEELDLSVRTINNHLDDLVEEERVQTQQIGNATAYYPDDTDIPSHQKPNYHCKRCGRAIDHLDDYGKVENHNYYEKVVGDPGTADFFILCRFCHEDFIKWVHGDDGSMGDYPFVDRWNVPEKQKKEVKNDPDIDTEPPDTDV